MKNEQEARPNRTLSPTILVAFHGILWIVLPVILLWTIIPAFEKTLIDFDSEMPAMTVLAIVLSNCLVRYFYLMFPLIAAFCWIDLTVLRALDRRPEATVPRRLWLALMLLVPLGFMAAMVVAIFLPLMTPMQDLS